MSECPKWIEVKDLANEQGAMMSQNCPLDTVCDRKRCIFDNAIQKTKEEIKHADAS
jgi:hypothetical protein